MAAGDVVSGFSTSVANNGFMTIQASTGQEWVIHNIYYAGAVEFYVTDGTNSIKFDSDTGAGARLGGVFHVTETKYLQVKNVAGTTAHLAYDGIQTK